MTIVVESLQQTMTTENELALHDERLAPIIPPLSPLALLDKAMERGITAENVGVMRDLMQMVREQRADEAKAAFAKALFQLRKNMPEIYVDKAAKNAKGEVAYRYCSEEEITSKLDPHLIAYGFTTLFSQAQVDGKVAVTVTLMHEAGHSTEHHFTVRPGATNAMKDASSADSGAATTALRHLLMKLFGLKSHMVNAPADAKIEGEFISDDKIAYLEEQIKETGFNREKFFQLAGCSTLDRVTEGKYDVLVNALAMKGGRA